MCSKGYLQCSNEFDLHDGVSYGVQHLGLLCDQRRAGDIEASKLSGVMKTVGVTLGMGAGIEG